MPPEPFPWDRKDFSRERKHHNNGYDRVSEPLRGGSVSRCRGSPSHGSRNEFGRWGVPSDFRRPPGHEKQGSWHLYHEDMSNGYSAARSGDRFFQDGGGFRPSGPYRDGRCNRNFRENRAASNQKDWRGNSWDYNHHHNMPPSGPGRLYNGKDQKLVDGPYSDEADTSAQFHSNEQPDEPCDVSVLDMDQKVELENSQASADWKPFKWSRSGSLTSRGSSFSLSSSSKSVGEFCDLRIELPLKISTPDESSSGDALGCLQSPTSLEDTTSRKKPRLGWGEGLAKFEKKRVDDPDDSQMKSSSTLCTRNTESMHSPVQNLADKSPRAANSLECRSPLTPSSVPFTSSPGLDDKSVVKDAEIDSDYNNLSPCPAPRYQNHFEELSPSLEYKEYKSLNLNGSLNELFQNENQRLGDSGFIKTSAVNKLLLLKGDILKALELTESEIDSLENELKSLKAQPGSNSPYPESSSSMLLDCKEKPGPVLKVQRLPLLKVDSSGDVINVDMAPCCNNFEEAPPKRKDEYIGSPATVATSKFMEPLFSDKFPPVDQQKHGRTGDDMVVVESAKYEVRTSVDLQNVTGSSAPDSDSRLAKAGNVSGQEYVTAFDNLGGCELSSILACNKKTAARASNLFSNLLPCSSCPMQSVEAVSARCSPKNSLIEEKFLKKQRSLRFRERTLCLKYRVLQNLWKEDLQLLSERKDRAKSQKKVESGYRSPHGGSQKQRPTIRLQVSSPACNSNLFPSSEVVSFTGKQLSDPQIRCYRNGLKMPSLILDKEQMLSRFLSDNGFVQDPCALEGERALVNPWTAEEKEIFLDKYATFGKDFKKISSFLDHKTTADCVEFYYKNHKSDFFKKTKHQEHKKQEKSALAARYLMTSGKKWNKEMNAASLDMLGAASAIVANEEKDKKSIKIFSSGIRDRKLRGNEGVRDTSSSYNIEDERETEAADALASICGSLSSEAMSSCITSSADPGEGTQDWKSRKACSEPSATRCPPTAEVTQNVDDDTCSEESCGCVDPVDWTDEEKTSFVQAFSFHGKDFVTISRCVQTKSRDQCKVFFSKARKCLGLGMLCPVFGNEEISAADDQDEGRSDAEDACVVEDDLATCGDRLSDRTDECKPVNASNLKQVHDENPMNLHDKVDISEECVPVQLSGNGLNRRSQFLLPCNSQPEDAPEVVGPDDGAVLNATAKNAVKSQYHESGDASVASVGEETFIEHDAPLNTNAVIGAKTEIASEKPEPNSKGGDQDNHEVSLASFSYECRRDKQVKRSASANDLHQPLLMSNCSSHFSMQMEVSVVASHLQPSIRPCVSRKETTSIQPLQVYLKKCHRAASVHSVGEAKNHSQRTGPVVSLRESSPDKTCVNGGVKLFGQILSNSSSGCEGRRIYSPSSYSSVDALPFNNDTYKHAHNSVSLGIENLPVRSYGLWDGNRMQTGYASLPDSSELLPKYSPAFDSPSLSTSELNVVQSNGLTDPVAALKLHYAKAKQQGR